MPIFLQRWQSQDAFTATKAVPQAQLLSLCGCSISPKVRYLSSVPSVHQKTDTCFTPGNLFHPRMALQEAVGEGNRDVCRAGTHCPDKLRVTGTDLISLTADTNTFWNLIQHRRELHHFRLHWSLNTSKHPCLKRTTLTAPNPRTSIYLWIGKWVVCCIEHPLMLWLDSMSRNTSCHQPTAQRTALLKPLHTPHQSPGQRCRSKARGRPPSAAPTAQHTPHTVPQAQPTASSAATAFLTHSHIPRP